MTFTFTFPLAPATEYDSRVNIFTGRLHPEVYTGEIVDVDEVARFHNLTASMQALVRGFIERRRIIANAQPSIFANVKHIPLFESTPLSELFPSSIPEQKYENVPAADFHEYMAYGDSSDPDTWSMPRYVYQFKTATTARRLGKGQLGKAVKKIHDRNDVVKALFEYGKETMEKAAILYNDAVCYIEIKSSNKGKRVKANIRTKQNTNQWIELDKKGWEWWVENSAAAAALKW